MLSPIKRVVVTPDHRKLEAFTLGEGPHLVVCEAGLGMSAHYWLPVMNELAASVQVIAYNRAGLGGSDPDDAKRSLKRLADDLESIIESQSCTSVVLVGHSWGGPIIRTLAMKAGPVREKLRGLVLVDPTDEHLLSAYHPLTLAVQATVLVLLARFGLFRPLVKQIIHGLPEEAKKQVLDDSSTLRAAQESALELQSLRTGLKMLGASAFPPDIPVILLSGALAMVGETKKMRTRIQQAHLATVKKMAGAKLIVANKSGHNVPITQPELIAKVALQLFQTT